MRMFCVNEDRLHQIFTMEHGGSLQSKTSAQGERAHPFVSQNKAKLQHFKQTTWFRFDLIHRICHRTGRVIQFLPILPK